MKSEQFLVDGKYICPNCDQEFPKMGICSHYKKVHLLSRNEKIPWNKGLTKETDKRIISPPSWCKGLTKNTDSRIKKIGETYSKRVKSGEIKPWQTGLSKETDERLLKVSKQISKTINQKVSDGDWHYSFSKTRSYKYKGVSLHGSWELAYAKWLDDNEIRWERPTLKTTSFSYTFEGKTKRYIPDFYLPDDDLYIEIKGYETEKDRAKWNAFPHKLKVIKGEELVSLGIIEQ